jgi:hypothetical protein
MQQDNNIANKLRQLDDMQAPDLSNMDAHWQQMAAMLQPGAAPVKKAWPKWMLNTLSVTTVVLLIGAALWYLSAKKDGSNNTTAIQSNSTQAEKQPEINPAAVTDSSLADDSVVAKALINNSSKMFSAVNDANDFTTDSEPSIFDTLKINFTDCNTCPAKNADSAVVADVQRKILLQNLFQQLEKAEQLRTIDNSRDTLIRFEEGTVLLIPAKSLGGMNGVTIIAKEYYKKADIVLNQLNTASNKDQLVTGGMLHLKAMYQGNEIAIDQQRPLKLYMPDTSSNMNGMQLFEGQQAVANINWVAQNQFFVQKRMVTEVRVLNVIDQPVRVIETAKGNIGYFVIDEDSLQMAKPALRELLKNKYGYYKVKFRSSTRDWFSLRPYSKDQFSNLYGTRIGDSVWMDKVTADRYQLVSTVTRQVTQNSYSVMPVNLSSLALNRVNNRPSFDIALDTPRNGYKNYADDYNKILSGISNQYSVDLNKMGWINCDRFYSDSRKKINFNVDLGDAAMNYYTMLVFDNIKSMMTGFVYGNKVSFQNIPAGEAVKLISIGINKKGEAVYSVTKATTGTQELTGIHFESTSAPDLKTALSKMDQ